MWQHLLWLSGKEVGSPASVSVIGTSGPLKGWPEVAHHMEVMRGLARRRQGLLQVCVILLLTLSAIYKG